MATCKSKIPKISIVIPTLNEEKNISNLLFSLKTQSFNDFETIIVDGGSSDKTIQKARKLGAKTVVKPGLKEFPSRNEGVKIARGEILLFSGADVIMLEKTLETIVYEFEKNKIDGLCAFGRIRDAPLWGKMEYYLYYSLLRLWIKFTGDFHGSTNFMALKKEEFKKIGGFKNRIDADGYLLNLFAKNRKVKFLDGTKCFFVSGRRMRKMGFFNFNFHFLYILDIFFPFLRESKIIKMLKRASANYRASESKNKGGNFEHSVENISKALAN
ncbi:MAG: glycosyltransferase family 2 protein [Promethearchaeota archaeon]